MEIKPVILIAAAIAAFFLLLSYAAMGAMPLDDWTVNVSTAGTREARSVSIVITNTGLTPSVIDSVYVGSARCPMPRDGPVYEVDCINGVTIVLSEYNEFLEDFPFLTGAPTINKIGPGGRALLRIIFYIDRNPELANIKEIRVRTLSGKTLTINYGSGLSVQWSAGLG